VLDDLKALISKPLILASPKPGETLLLYVVTTTQVVSAALVVEQEEPGQVYKVQRLVYYISKVSSICETRYNQVQKLLYAVLIMKRKLLHYFECHLVLVVTSFGIKEIVGNHLTTGRITKWALELMGLDVTPSFKIKTRCSSYVCLGSSCHTYGQNVNIENQCLYYINFIT
jgi:hypothetical protein